ncbi:MAG TPA: thiamine phosphate synthase [Mesorhizobium sp.]|jgi:thiamine-phosphate pyrophosphorylase|nr:thiamine phosphate synthase [Mesorhizobium sp.]
MPADASPPNRCRLVLVVPLGLGDGDFPLKLGRALGAGDVASVILPQGELPEREFQARAESLVGLAKSHGAAAVLAADRSLAFRLGADGVHVEGGADALREAVERAEGKIAVGAGGARTRDEALNLGEARPDYLFFGRFGYDEKPDPHPRNLSLGQWWAEMINIPAIVMAGSDLASVEAVAATGVEFAGLCAAVFGEGRDPAQSVAEANRILDETGPRWNP